jgi:hypothetical protein
VPGLGTLEIQMVAFPVQLLSLQELLVMMRDQSGD